MDSDDRIARLEGRMDDLSRAQSRAHLDGLDAAAYLVALFARHCEHAGLFGIEAVRARVLDDLRLPAAERVPRANATRCLLRELDAFLCERGLFSRSRDAAVSDRATED